MTSPQTAPYGSWKSPITSDLIVAGTIGLGGVAFDGEDIYWLEGRPTEGGRNVLVRRTPDGTVTDITPRPFNVRTRVHEYGGGSYLIVDGTIYFSNFADQRIYKQTRGSQPQPLTPESKRRYADAIIDSQRNRLICICEDHTQADREPENTIVSVDLDTGEVRVLVSGSDFYSSPRLCTNGTHLAWMSWNHPNMPWDESQLWIATINADGSLGEATCIAGGTEESIGEPRWSPDGRLYFSSDRTGWWNLYRYNRDGTIESLCEMEAEFAYPHWVFGLSNYGFASESRIICTYTQNGSWYLASLDANTKQLQPIDTPYNNISSLRVRENKILFIGGSPTQQTAVVILDLETGKTEILKRSSDLEIDPGYLSIPEALAFPTENGLTAYAWYYPPKNKDCVAPEGELPPLLVKSHGGPTAAASASLNLRVQYWTSRGFAYLDVNYGGSTGYGREYRQRLDRNWGIVDVDDCVNAAKYLVRQGKADGNRMAISGGSAGGYTTLAALTFKDTFKAGASYYGVSDLEVLVRDTHKFESHYLDRLVGKYPEQKAIYETRSPIYHINRLSCPVIFFQGLEDRVVPPNQAEMMVDVLKKKGLPVAYVPFEGEQHGFRRAENIKCALDGEFYFYSRVFGFEPADAIAPIAIDNL
ncbi:dipeptidyl aminopeptidase/acylaminoacyl peptidase [Pleurocapsa sp. PCC 7327]|uniref:S9 family peptidase n=1 Tax=Pleurocapsa sp. PCC 7327 TaxID=118163 RepID=UPI00029FB0C8|nr:S9 family peptidase [Pleurocapsa sp. PCC 7327]AFY77265.1 dipeptidyl aminopeptidase/acylaminoacyl peptidase [Pleurocapsa sp. PCC 7327]